MADFLEIPKGIRFLNAVQADERYGPWNSVAEALTSTANRRVVGLKVGIFQNGSTVDYWFRDGIENEDLIPVSAEINWDSTNWQSNDLPLNFHKLKVLPTNVADGVYFTKADGNNVFKMFIVDDANIIDLDAIGIDALSNYYTKPEADGRFVNVTGDTMTGVLNGTSSNWTVSVTSPLFVGNLQGNASSATILQTARTIALSGAATGTATSFNGSANITIPVTGLNASNLNAGTVPLARIGTNTSGVGKYLRGDNTWVDFPPIPQGTVTSINATVPTALLAVSGVPITTNGTIAITLPNRNPNLVFAGPSSGAAASPTFRSLVVADVPNLPTTKITSGVFVAARLGTGTANTTTFLRGDNTWQTINSGVLSVGLSMPNIFAVSGSPVTSTGTLTATLANQAAATVFAGPVAGQANTPIFRNLVESDIPALSAGKITSGTFATARLGGGTASSTTFLRGDGTWASLPQGTVYTGGDGINISTGAVVSIDTDFTDARYVNVTGDTMTGPLRGTTIHMYGRLESRQPVTTSGWRCFDLMTDGAGDPIRWSIIGTSTNFNFGIARYDNSNNYIDAPLTIDRTSGAVSTKLIYHSTSNTSGFVINLNTTALQRAGNITSNTTFTIANNGAGKMAQCSVRNVSGATVTVTVTGAIMLGTSMVPANSWAVISIMNDGVTTFATVVTQ